MSLPAAASTSTKPKFVIHLLNKMSIDMHSFNIDVRGYLKIGNF